MLEITAVTTQLRVGSDGGAAELRFWIAVRANSANEPTTCIIRPAVSIISASYQQDTGSLH
jgi:hypothetical protein